MIGRLNGVLEELREGDVHRAVGGLATEMDAIRNSLSAAEWREWIEGQVRPHPVYGALLEDPFTRHSAARPRGYPGDAELLDYIYGHSNVHPAIEGASELGRRLYAYTSQTAAPAAVRNRRALAAREIDTLAAGGSRPHVLSLACGHLREAPLVKALKTGALGRFVAADQDPLSLNVVRREWSRFGVETVETSAKEVIRNGAQKLGQFDFIYALGLYDYLSQEAGSRLLASLVGMLRPGGKVWVANFVSGLWSSGYMEAIMDWWLIYRSIEEMWSLAERIPPDRIGQQRLFLEPAENVAFLEVVRA